MLKESDKTRIVEILEPLSDNFNDDELEYAIKTLRFWLNERKRQENEEQI